MRKLGVLIALFLVIGIGFNQNKTVQAELGSNWTATMFPNTTLSGDGVTVTGVNGIYFIWDVGPVNINGTGLTDCPSSPTCNNNFSIRFTSKQHFSAGEYQFVVGSDDGVRIYIDGAVVLDGFVPRGRTYELFTYEMTAGLHDIVVEYFEGVGMAMLHVQWSLNIPPTAPFAAPTRNYFVDRDVPLTWSRISWATGYEVQVSKTIDFKVFAYHDDTLSADTLAVITTPLIDNGLYFWRVRGKKQNGDWGRWSVTNSFQVNAP